MQEREKYVKLMSAEGVTFMVEKKAANVSNYVKQMMASDGGRCQIPASFTGSRGIARVFSYIWCNDRGLATRNSMEVDRRSQLLGAASEVIMFMLHGKAQLLVIDPAAA